MSQNYKKERVMILQILGLLVKGVILTLILWRIIRFLDVFFHELMHTIANYICGYGITSFEVGKPPYLSFKLREIPVRLGLINPWGGEVGVYYGNKMPSKFALILINLAGPVSLYIGTVIFVFILLYPKDAMAFIWATFVQLPAALIALVVNPHSLVETGIPYVESMLYLTTHLTYWTNITLGLLTVLLVLSISNLIPHYNRGTNDMMEVARAMVKYKQLDFDQRLSKFFYKILVATTVIYCLVAAVNIFIYRQEFANLFIRYVELFLTLVTK